VHRKNKNEIKGYLIGTSYLLLSWGLAYFLTVFVFEAEGMSLHIYAALCSALIIRVFGEKYILLEKLDAKDDHYPQ
jgi:hypothetical protein